MMWELILQILDGKSIVVPVGSCHAVNFCTFFPRPSDFAESLRILYIKSLVFIYYCKILTNGLCYTDRSPLDVN